MNDIPCLSLSLSIPVFSQFSCPLPPSTFTTFPVFKTFSWLKCNQGLILDMFYTKEKMIGTVVKLLSLLKTPAMYQNMC